MQEILGGTARLTTPGYAYDHSIKYELPS